MKKETKLIIIVIGILVVLVGVFAYINAGDVDYKKQLQSNAEFDVSNGEKTVRITMDDLLSLNVVEIDAILDTSDTDPTDIKLEGVLINEVLEYAGIEVLEGQGLEVKALDGYTSAITNEELLQKDNVYLCIAMNGEALKPKSEGGMGPYLMVIKSAQYSQRWCKFVQEIKVK